MVVTIGVYAATSQLRTVVTVPHYLFSTGVLDRLCSCADLCIPLSRERRVERQKTGLFGGFSHAEILGRGSYVLIEQAHVCLVSFPARARRLRLVDGPNLVM